MLNKEISGIYNKCRIHLYSEIFTRFVEHNESLTTAEAFSMEGIVALGKPTISEFARLMGISASNAAYKTNNLVEKGFLEKVQSKNDRREYRLQPTQKFKDFYRENFSYLDTVVERIHERFSKAECRQLGHMLHVIQSELIPELNIEEMLREKK